MKNNTVESYKKVDEFLMKMCIVFFIILILTQWYLRNFSKGLEPFLNKYCANEGLSYKVIEIAPKEISNSE